MKSLEKLVSRSTFKYSNNSRSQIFKNGRKTISTTSETMNEQQKTLRDVSSKKFQMQRQDDCSTSKSDNYVNITPFEEFKSRKEKFTFYLERFENYCQMKSIVNAEKKHSYYVRQFVQHTIIT
ncbi:hypothetical protein HHI36_012819 [Cryptolaemus montrouzieri]|uniref:Uncharacterized protein n=1 Tax=Cryptolaemus montrouzieri TaxID=559131 RepID=A0ABD2NFB9_9CUCU